MVSVSHHFLLRLHWRPQRVLEAGPYPCQGRPAAVESERAAGMGPGALYVAAGV